MINEEYNEDEDICKIKNEMSNQSTINESFLHIQSLRNIYKADLVGMIVSNRSNSCGCGTIPNDWSKDTSDEAYFVATVRCATKEYSFAHEVGHLFVSN